MKVLIWLRRCLRLHDNPSLLAIEKAEKVFVVYIVDPEVTSKMSPNRLKFLYQSLKDLDRNLREKCSSTLMVFHGNPLEILPSFIVQNGIFRLYGDKDLEEYGEHLEVSLKPVLANLGVHTKFYHSHSLYDLDVLLQVFGGTPPLNFAHFCLQVEEFGPPPVPASSPGKFPTPLEEEMQGRALPSPEGFGISQSDMENQEMAVEGGETQGLAQLAKTLQNPSWVESFENQRTNPTAITPSTSLLSPFLALGAVSPRRYYATLLTTYRETTRKPQDFSATLYSQILWREFFLLLSYSYANFGQIENNPLCWQIEWDENKLFEEKFVEGKTGFPWIDACINQLKRCGWLHHLAKHALACFLTRGDLWLSWEIGRDLFEKYMIDHDWSLSNGNWIWMSGGGIDGQHGSLSKVLVYNPAAFPREYDPEGNFIRHFIPVLKDFPTEYIFEPWKAPLEVQREAHCIIGEDYPHPLVDHELVLKENTQKLHECHSRFKNTPFPKGEAKVRDSVSFQAVNALKRKREEAERGHTGQSTSSNGWLLVGAYSFLSVAPKQKAPNNRIPVSSLLNDREEPVPTTSARQQESLSTSSLSSTAISRDGCC